VCTFLNRKNGDSDNTFQGTNSGFILEIDSSSANTGLTLNGGQTNKAILGTVPTLTDGVYKRNGHILTYKFDNSIVVAMYDTTMVSSSIFTIFNLDATPVYGGELSTVYAANVILSYYSDFSSAFLQVSTDMSVGSGSATQVIILWADNYAASSQSYYLRTVSSGSLLTDLSPATSPYKISFDWNSNGRKFSFYILRISSLGGSIRKYTILSNSCANTKPCRGSIQGATKNFELSL
jgi:hypothetical protein